MDNIAISLLCDFNVSLDDIEATNQKCMAHTINLIIQESLKTEEYIEIIESAKNCH